MKNKFFKSITFVVAIAMLMSMVPAVVSADADDEPFVKVKVEGDMVTVTATVSVAEYTLLAVRDSFAYDGVEDIPADEADLELQVEYIDQRDDIVDGKIEVTFPLRDREGDLAMAVTDRYINVFIGGAGVDAQVGSYSKKYDAPVLAVEDLKEKYYSEDEEVVVTIEFADDTLKALWESKDLVAKIGDEELSDVNWDALTDGYITIPASSFANASYANAVITIAEVADAEFEVAKTDKVSFAIASRVEEAKAAIVKTLEQVPNADDSAVTIKLPVDTVVSEVAIAYELISTEGFTDNGDGTITVVRPTGEDAESIVIKFKATLTYGELEIDPIEFSVSVRAAGVAVDPANIEFANWEGDVYVDVYDIEGASIIEIAKGDLDPSKDGLRLAGQAFYYSPVREKYIGVVAGYTDAESVSADIEITPEAPVSFYYGWGDDPTHEYYEEGDRISINDVMRALQIKNGVGDEPSILDFLVCDVEQDGVVDLNDVMLVLQAKNGLFDKFDIEEN